MPTIGRIVENAVKIAQKVGFENITLDVMLGIPNQTKKSLNETLDFPFSYHMNGKEGIITRKLCPLFGSHVMFCNVSYDSEGADPEQLHVRAMVDAYRALGEL